ncbi:hypothetical protein NQ317_017138 [Molorchus minor]|uniref:Integrase zinc-binding domain-containing protein n=1 Tax=Molorchus minor TaxID=1323400 RepID=A0ABQ9JHJ7_9CUCU|nr:hypothetical protein NQ317_017138 [Molorchus minor]
MYELATESPERYPLWRCDGGKLYKHAKSRYPELVGPSGNWKLVVPKEDRIQIIKSCHDPPTCGHLGVFKTTARISNEYYWPKMRSDVAKYIRHCAVCLSTKPEQKRPAGLMLSAQTKVSRPWELLSADLDVKKRLKGAYDRSKTTYNLRRRDDRFDLEKLSGKLSSSWRGVVTVFNKINTKLAQVVRDFTSSSTRPAAQAAPFQQGRPPTQLLARVLGKLIYLFALLVRPPRPITITQATCLYERSHQGPAHRVLGPASCWTGPRRHQELGLGSPNR